MPKNDAIFPHFIGMELPPVLTGLVIAAVFAATISTLSANLSAASSAIVSDFYMRFQPSASERGGVRLGQLCVVVCGFAVRFGIHPFLIGGIGLAACIVTGVVLSWFHPRRIK